MLTLKGVIKFCTHTWHQEFASDPLRFAHLFSSLPNRPGDFLNLSPSYGLKMKLLKVLLSKLETLIDLLWLSAAANAGGSLTTSLAANSASNRIRPICSGRTLLTESLGWRLVSSRSQQDKNS